jgi:hypothetical protein
VEFLLSGTKSVQTSALAAVLVATAAKAERQRWDNAVQIDARAFHDAKPLTHPELRDCRPYVVRSL